MGAKTDIELANEIANAIEAGECPMKKVCRGVTVYCDKGLNHRDEVHRGHHEGLDSDLVWVL